VIPGNIFFQVSIWTTAIAKWKNDPLAENGKALIGLGARTSDVIPGVKKHLLETINEHGETPIGDFIIEEKPWR